MTTNDLSLCRNYPARPARLTDEKTKAGRHENASPWWAYHRTANDRLTRSISMASAFLLTSAY